MKYEGFDFFFSNHAHLLIYRIKDSIFHLLPKVLNTPSGWAANLSARDGGHQCCEDRSLPYPSLSDENFF
jgi:hypothetical protein